MAIPEAQLETWSHQGAVPRSRDTYATIKGRLEAAGSADNGKDYSIFLQGSYANDTNIYSESDVDVVIRLNSVFYHDLSLLPEDQKAAWAKVFPDAEYGYYDFKRDVLAWLNASYPGAVTSGDKAINIAASGNRRKADVIVAIEYRRYYKFLTVNDQSYTSGISFKSADGTLIANYPKQHSENCTSKHQATSSWFKPMVRIFKNMRRTMVDQDLLEAGIAPSYYIEGLLYNVPADKFGRSYADAFLACLSYIIEADRSKFVCANEQYYLLREGSPVTWRDAKCTEFIAALSELWSDW
jgi:predicted nucleotidyltransferase